MSHTHGIDNDDHLFHFDPCEEADLPGTVQSPQPSTSYGAFTLESTHLSIPMSTHGDLASTDALEAVEASLEPVGKGKAVTKYMAILSPADCHSSHHSPHLSPLTPSSPAFHSSPFSEFSDNSLPDIRSSTPDRGKGKGKDLPPVLPPLAFSPTELNYGNVDWPSLAGAPSPPGPSSYGSYSNPSMTSTNNTPLMGSTADRNKPEAPDVASSALEKESSHVAMHRLPFRPRSLSSLSMHSAPSPSARPISRIKSKLKLSSISANLTPKLLRPNIYASALFPQSDATQLNIGDFLQGSSDSPNTFQLRQDTKAIPISQTSQLDGKGIFADPEYKPPNLRTKGRSKTSPYPVSAFDYIPDTSQSLFAPLPLIIRNYFDDFLPRELRLRVLWLIIESYEADHMKAVREGRWSVARASSTRGRWVGRDKGLRELVKLSRVSKSWQNLVFDGQLWTDLDIHPFPRLPYPVLMRLTAIGGPFATKLDLSGHTELTPDILSEIVDNLSSSPVVQSLPSTQLTSVDLRGCTELTTRSLHHLLVRCPALQSLSLKGLRAVTNTTCDFLSSYCPQLVKLDLSRCPNMDAQGIENIAINTLARREQLLWKELRLSGLKNINDSTLAALGKAAPLLEVLDLSYARQLHNSALDAFVACDEDLADWKGDAILVYSREIGRETGDSIRYRRRVTNLRHLMLSFCIMLTDHACSNLAHSVPKLEYLELAGIGAELRDEGLVRLLNTTPYIRRLDLEDASEITDALIATITPGSGSNDEEPAAATPVPGHVLEYLAISYASNVTDDAVLALIQHCPHLTCLEADNTRIGANVIREFVRLSKARVLTDAKIVTMDCRGVSESLVKELSNSTRPRKGWRSHDARKLMYLDARDGCMEDLKIGQDECDEKRVILKSFYSWQTVDAVQAAKEKRRKSSRRNANQSSGITDDYDAGPGRSTRWWSPGGRRTPGSGRLSPLSDMNSDSCTVM